MDSPASPEPADATQEPSSDASQEQPVDFTQDMDVLDVVSF